MSVGRRPPPLVAIAFVVAAALTLAGCGAVNEMTAPPSAVAALSPTPIPTVVPVPTPTPQPDPTSRLVEVDGRTQAIDCRGTGSPTVILEPGLGVPAWLWQGVQRDLADAPFRVCRYDRAGLADSDPSDAPRAAEVFVGELRNLLAAAGEKPPYVLVGHSLGGLIVQLFAREHPDEVAGAVFVDAIHPDLDRRIEQIISPGQASQRRGELALNQEGITFDDVLASDEQVRDAPPFPPIPIVVIRHGQWFTVNDRTWPAHEVEDLWTELQEDLATLSPHSTLVVAEDSQHRIMVSQPDLVADQIRAVVEQSGAP